MFQPRLWLFFVDFCLGSNYISPFVAALVINPISSSKIHLSYKNKICINGPQKIFKHLFSPVIRLGSYFLWGRRRLFRFVCHSESHKTPSRTWQQSFAQQVPHPPGSCPPTAAQKLRGQDLLGLHVFKSQFEYLLDHRKLLVYVFRIDLKWLEWCFPLSP